MIKEVEVEILGHPASYKHYISLGYDIVIKKYIKVKSIHLSKGSTINVTCICSICNKETKNKFKDYWNYTDGLITPYYCKSCSLIKQEKTSYEKYGTKNPMQNESVKNKLKNSLIKKYGVDWYSKTDEWLCKFKKTSLEKYGVDNPSKDSNIIDRIKATNQKNIGVDWPMQSEEILEKSKQTSLKNWGVTHYSKTVDWKENLISKNQRTYGVDWYSQTEDCKIKIFNTNEFLWGGHPSRTENFKNSVKSSKERKTYKKYMGLISDKYEFISYKNESFHLIHKKCGQEFFTYKGLLRARYSLGREICNICNPVGVQFSGLELEVIQFLDEIGIKYIRNTRNVLDGQELDIYIPEFNLGIEINGIYWHSEIFKPSNYHLNKTNIARTKGVDLIHIWEDDWNHKKNIIKSILSNRLIVGSYKIFSRKCDIKKVETKIYKKFLEENHIQGYASSSINIGLFFDNELVSLMTFGWRRTNNKREFELIRFCNKIGTNIVGGASRLFEFFKNNYDYDKIVSYSDISIFSGDIYKRLGFSSEGISDPNYFWVVGGIKRHRYNFSKRKLVKLGFDPNKSEVEIMHSRGYYRVFSTGQERWVYSL